MGTAGTPTGDAGNGNNGNGEVSLMLKIRAEALSTNLEKVRSFVRRAPNRRAEIEKVEADLRDLSEVIRNIRVSAYKAKVATEDESRDPPDTQQELRQRVTELQGKLSDVE